MDFWYKWVGLQDIFQADCVPCAAHDWLCVKRKVICYCSRLIISETYCWLVTYYTRAGFEKQEFSPYRKNWIQPVKLRC
ncbi:hypothetical protein Q8A67_008820 [Cirrhinus molitorella]|uniref:Uncharacterized protein n=1 Tax=Cirrhinus molitorella TaxID=172907 RepID=A0AA88PZ38_9TELE|nr:hypothetical protein Q8A67_008820 [Cirrhinus molitorella]